MFFAFASSDIITAVLSSSHASSRFFHRHIQTDIFSYALPPSFSFSALFCSRAPLRAMHATAAG
jgi:hypothetical protein